MNRPGWQHLITDADMARLRGMADQMDLLAYLVSMSASPTSNANTTSRPIDLQLPAPGLDAMLRSWAETLSVTLDHAVPAIGPQEPRA